MVSVEMNMNIFPISCGQRVDPDFHFSKYSSHIVVILITVGGIFLIECSFTFEFCQLQL